MRPTHRLSSTALAHIIGDRRIVASVDLDTVAAGLGTAICQLEPGIGTYATAYLLGQCVHESGGFRWARELWDGKGAQASYRTRRDLQGPGLLWPGIGRHYRGGGWIQTTGRANYRQAADLLRLHDVPVRSPYWLAANAHRPMYASLLALAWWAPRMPNNMSGQDWTVERVTRAVNGGLTGLEGRRVFTRRAIELRHDLRPVRI